MATMPSQGGPVSSSLGYVPQAPAAETDEERRRRLAQIAMAAGKSTGLVSNTVAGTGVGGY